MIIKRDTKNPGPCDRCANGETNKPAEYAHVCRGASGRYCEVMWVCEGCVIGGTAKDALTYEQAYAEIGQRGDGYADF